VDRVSKLLQISAAEAQGIAELALRFTLSPPAVSTVIPGMRSMKNVESNCALSDGRLLSEKLLSELKNHRWVRDFYH